MLFSTPLQTTATLWVKFFCVVQRFLQDKKHALRQWSLTIHTLNTETHWQQIVASWGDIQAGRLVTATQAFADLEILEETEGLCHE